MQIRFQRGHLHLGPSWCSPPIPVCSVWNQKVSWQLQEKVSVVLAVRRALWSVPSQWPLQNGAGVVATAAAAHLVQMLGSVLSATHATPHQILTTALWGGYLLSSQRYVLGNRHRQLKTICSTEITHQPGIILLLCSSLFSFQGGSCVNIGLYF